MITVHRCLASLLILPRFLAFSFGYYFGRGISACRFALTFFFPFFSSFFLSFRALSRSPEFDFVFAHFFFPVFFDCCFLSSALRGWSFRFCVIVLGGFRSWVIMSAAASCAVEQRRPFGAFRGAAVMLRFKIEFFVRFIQMARIPGISGCTTSTAANSTLYHSHLS